MAGEFMVKSSCSEDIIGNLCLAISSVFLWTGLSLRGLSPGGGIQLSSPGGKSVCCPPIPAKPQDPFFSGLAEDAHAPLKPSLLQEMRPTHVPIPRDSEWSGLFKPEDREEEGRIPNRNSECYSERGEWRQGWQKYQLSTL
jgi:hypothetical protein